MRMLSFLLCAIALLWGAHAHAFSPTGERRDIMNVTTTLRLWERHVVERGDMLVGYCRTVLASMGSSAHPMRCAVTIGLVNTDRFDSVEDLDYIREGEVLWLPIVESGTVIAVVDPFANVDVNALRAHLGMPALEDQVAELARKLGTLETEIANDITSLEERIDNTNDDVATLRAEFSEMQMTLGVLGGWLKKYWWVALLAALLVILIWLILELLAYRHMKSIEEDASLAKEKAEAAEIAAAAAQGGADQAHKIATDVRDVVHHPDEGLRATHSMATHALVAAVPLVLEEQPKLSSVNVGATSRWIVRHEVTGERFEVLFTKREDGLCDWSVPRNRDGTGTSEPISVKSPEHVERKLRDAYVAKRLQYCLVTSS